MKKTALLLLAALSIAVPAALAQEAPAPPPVPKTPKPPAREMKREMHVEHRTMGPEGGMGFGPGGGMPQGAWWKNPDLTQKINLTPDQQKRIEEIFMQTRVQLIHAHAALEEQELMLEPLMSANPIDQGKALASDGTGKSRLKSVSPFVCSQ